MNKKLLKVIALVCCLVLGVAAPGMVNAHLHKPSSTPFPCGTCLGKKTITDYNGRTITCPKCLGSGNEPDQGQNDYSVKATSFPDTKKTCKGCQGAKGWNTSYGWVTCDRCHGSGVEPNK